MCIWNGINKFPIPFGGDKSHPFSFFFWSFHFFHSHPLSLSVSKMHRLSSHFQFTIFCNIHPGADANKHAADDATNVCTAWSATVFQCWGIAMQHSWNVLHPIGKKNTSEINKEKRNRKKNSIFEALRKKVKTIFVCVTATLVYSNEMLIFIDTCLRTCFQLENFRYRESNGKSKHMVTFSWRIFDDIKTGMCVVFRVS